MNIKIVASILIGAVAVLLIATASSEPNPPTCRSAVVPTCPDCPTPIVPSCPECPVCDNALALKALYESRAAIDAAIRELEPRTR